MKIGIQFKRYSRLSVILRWTSVLFFILLICEKKSDAQWRIPTPRDTVTVPANQSSYVTSKIFLTAGGVDMWVSPSGTFTENDGTLTFGMDGAYTDLINGSSLIPQAQNPPDYGGKIHNYSFTVTTIPGGSNETPFISLENSYQANHIYTAHYPSQGNRFQFRIRAEKAVDYPRATGSLVVKMARWTAGIAIENAILDFGNVLIGSSKPILDSIASYGLDPLQIDSIKVIDPIGLGDYSFLSERNNRFTLPTEQTNQLKISFSPSLRGPISAELHIYSHNADPVSRLTIIYLNGFGVAPDFGVGPSQIDFGKVRIGYPKVGFTQISNSKGNATLHVNTNTQYQQYQPVPPPVAFSFAPQTVPPLDITSGSIGQIRTIFSPSVRTKYQGVLRVRADNVPFDSVQITGEGAQPIPVLTPPKNSDLDFGYVYNGNTNTETVTLTNTGNWTASVILARISGSFKSMFTFSPADSEFNVEPDSGRVFTIAFHPGTGQDSLHILGYFELVYDDNTIDTIRLVGVEIQPEVLISPLSHDFGRVKVGASKQDTVTYVRTTPKANSSVRLQEDVRPGVYFSEVGKIGTINPGENIPFVCKFKPTVPGPATAWAYITANGKRDSIQLTGIGAVAKAIFNPTPVNYGIVPSNHPDTLSTNLKDSGDYALQVDSIKINGADSNDFHILWQTNGTTPNPPFTIDPDSSINIEVWFATNALTGAVHQADLCVYYHDGTSDCIPIQAIEEAQYLQFAQSSVDFGKQRIRTHTQAPGVFRNGSNKPLSVGAVTATSAANVFSLIDTLPTVKAQSRDSVLVDFFPQTRGFFTGYLHAFGGDIKTDSIQLRGQGAAPLPEFSTAVVDFGIVVLNTTKVDSFELQDTGDWFLKAVKIEKISDKYSEFNYSKGSQLSIASDSIGEKQYSTYQVTFRPTQTVVYHSAKLLFTFDDSTQGVVKLIGYDESPTVVLDADTMNFGKVRLGTPPPSNVVNIVSTSRKTLTVQNLGLSTSAPGNTFVSTPASGPVTIPPQTLYPVNITFQPPAIGTFTATLLASGNDVRNDSVSLFITGIGAAPVTVLSSKILDFGTLFPGYSASRSLTISDSGNWELSVAKVDVVGTNKADFTLRNIPPQFTILEDSSSPYIVDFLGTTPYQAAPRTAQIIFTLDDGSTFTVDLIEQDIEPIKVDLRMDNARARLGDVVYPCLRLKTDLPDSLHILDLKGVITYDATLFDLDRTGVRAGDMIIKLGNWKLISNSADLPGQFTYELQGTSTPLSKAGSLLRLKFAPRNTDPLGAKSPLQNTQFSFPLRTELNPLVTDAILVVDSTCGDINLESGSATANMIDQNMPNPFGPKIGNNETQIPFDIGFDNTSVTIRLLDVSGHEVARPVDKVSFNQGRYTVKIDASLFNSTGMYFYEFRAGDGKPIYKKMVVSK
ncbi:MAG: choice-of-anchor D domain-containing protein [Candidatus Kapaibacterium sp.]